MFSIKIEKLILPQMCCDPCAWKLEIWLLIFHDIEFSQLLGNFSDFTAFVPNEYPPTHESKLWGRGWYTYKDVVIL